MSNSLWKSLRLFSSAALLVLAVAFPVRGQTISQLTTNTQVFIIGQSAGQSFTATLTGVVTQIDVSPVNALSGVTLTIYSGATGTDGTLLYTQNNVDLGAGGLQAIPLNTPLAVTQGQQYTFLLQKSATTIPLYISILNPYLGGTIVVWGNLIQSAAHDLKFQVWEQVVVTPVPTLSETALLVFGGLILLIGVIYTRRRNSG